MEDEVSKSQTYGDLIPALTEYVAAYEAHNKLNPVTIPEKDPVCAAADHVLIMEILSRGYAVAKMPANELAEELGK